MKSEIKIFIGSPIIGKTVGELEKKFNIKIKYSTVFQVSKRTFKKEDRICPDVYIGLEGDVEDILKFTDYVISDEKHNKAEQQKCTKCGTYNAIICEICFNNHKTKLSRIFRRKVYKSAENKCELCGFDDIRCLTIHHKDKKHYPYDPDKAQLLCYNCHMGIAHSNKQQNKIEEVNKYD